MNIDLFGESKNGNFKPVLSTSTPHPFMIGARHVAYASDHHGGMLTKEAIERSGVPCGMRGCNLSYSEHKPVLLIGCWDDLKNDKGEVNPELHEYLLSIKELAEKEGVEGFGFVDKTKETRHVKQE